MHSPIDPVELTWARFLSHLECREGMDIAVCVKSHSFMQISRVIVNQKSSFKVQRWKVQYVCMCKPYSLSLILTTDLKFGVQPYGYHVLTEWLSCGYHVLTEWLSCAHMVVRAVTYITNTGNSVYERHYMY